MNHFEQLLEKLNKMVPLSKGYEDQLGLLLKVVNRKNGFKFIEPGQLVTKSWQVLSGYVIAFARDKNDQLLAMDIYSQGDFFTERPSLHRQSPAHYAYVAISKVKAYELSESRLQLLKKYPETLKLLFASVVDDRERALKKEGMLLLPEKERVIDFFTRYSVHDLPDQYAASFLRMALQDYYELKVKLLDSGEIKMSGALLEPGTHTFNLQTIYDVKAYLKKNYARQDIGNTVQIASRFNTTKTTLTRMFKRVLNTTVHKLLLRIRMEKALSLLSSGSTSLQAVADAVGYKDVYHFNKEFKKYYRFSTKEATKRGLQQADEGI